ncbi:hypothetical protein [Opitutus terrae]|uniref:DUF2066 domain-containing protein n=1 Tax=Opitutus terrae (strain DSM 11246 / JCM 15787 / PB90-1) TaxID=452637 RepID=B1ZZ83_OPITP|nr:hypothetical protein [Opitutus terrae]ACB77155.1 hypothetical protein Oter_3881 [Opitutus terrae PB90-1]
MQTWSGRIRAGLDGVGRALLAAALTMAATKASAQESFFSRFFHHDVEVITVTDMTPQGRLLRQPNAANPIYYEALVLGYQDYGRSIAGLRPPQKKEMLKLILKILADQGYHPGSVKHMPEVLLVLSWGTLNYDWGKAMLFMGGDKLDILWEMEPLSISNTVQALTRFRQSSLAQLVKESSQGPLYVISILALDRAAAVEGKTRLLWHTKVSCPAIGLALTPTLKQMARQAAPHVGRETAQPVWVTAPPREGRVDLGELKVIETIDPDVLPITDADDGPDAVGPQARKRRDEAAAAAGR